MEPWIEELRSVISNGGAKNRAHARMLAKDAAAHIPDPKLAETLEASLREALHMIAVADEFGYGAMARQLALAVVAKMAAAGR